MRLTRLRLKNWKNFAAADVLLEPRVFVIGDNGTGKSNLLDALRFLRDIANPEGGGLQAALSKRGGLKQTRLFSIRQKPVVKVGVEMVEDNGGKSPVHWKYEISIKQESAGKRRMLLESEEVLKDGQVILERPDKDDEGDPDRLTQTALEQITSNKKFRVLQDFFRSIKYLHIVPQLIRHSADVQGRVLPDDPFGQDLMSTIAGVSKTVRSSRLRKISEALTTIKPAFTKGNMEMEFFRNEKDGRPHLRFKYPTCRANDSWQTEEIFSDGELRLIGLLWTLLESNHVTLLEEPELSFNEGIVEKLPNLFADALESKKRKRGSRQIILSTHSHALLSDEDIRAEEILLLTPNAKGESTSIQVASKHVSIRREMEAGISAAQAVLRFAQSGDSLRLLL